MGIKLSSKNNKKILPLIYPAKPPPHIRALTDQFAIASVNKVKEINTHQDAFVSRL